MNLGDLGIWHKWHAKKGLFVIKKIIKEEDVVVIFFPKTQEEVWVDLVCLSYETSFYKKVKTLKQRRNNE